MNTSRLARQARPRGALGALSQASNWVVLVALLGASWQRCRDTHQRRMIERPKTKPEKLQVWEDEGGQNQMPIAKPN
jgi:hypothetical protein